MCLRDIATLQFRSIALEKMARSIHDKICTTRGQSNTRVSIFQVIFRALFRELYICYWLPRIFSAPFRETSIHENNNSLANREKHVQIPYVFAYRLFCAIFVPFIYVHKWCLLITIIYYIFSTHVLFLFMTNIFFYIVTFA